MIVGNHGQIAMKANPECQKKIVNQIYQCQIFYLQIKLDHLKNIN